MWAHVKVQSKVIPLPRPHCVLWPPRQTARGPNSSKSKHTMEGNLSVEPYAQLPDPPQGWAHIFTESIVGLQETGTSLLELTCQGQSALAITIDPSRDHTQTCPYNATWTKLCWNSSLRHISCSWASENINLLAIPFWIQTTFLNVGTIC